MIKYVAQEDPNGCIVATTAMVLGKSYAEVKAELQTSPVHKLTSVPDFVKSGVGITHQQWIFRQHKLYQLTDYLGWHADKVDGEWVVYEGDVWPPLPFAPVHVAQVTQIASGNAHSVVMLENGDVLDPYRPGVYSLDDPAWSEVSHVIGLIR